MKWAIEVQRTKLQRRNLSDLLNGIGYSLIDGIGYPAFTSPDLDICVTATEAFELAKRVRDVFTGPSQIDPDLIIGSVIDYSTNPPNRTAFLETHPVSCRFLD